MAVREKKNRICSKIVTAGKIRKKMLVQGRLLLKKKAKDGMTLAIAEREWSVRFDETIKYILWEWDREKKQ